MSANSVKVWDPLVRVGHWGLVAAFFTAYFTEDDFLGPHVWAGYIAGGIVCIRLLWGFVGTPNARFASFVRSPAVTLRYLRALAERKSRRYIGHNPAGGAMIVALLVFVFATAFSGVVLYGMEESAGPLAGWAGQYAASEKTWEELHEILANLTLLLVAIHVAGMLFSSYVHRENLVRAMLTGRKRAEDE